MPPAARATIDLTTHGTPLSPGPGSMNVKIGGLPAWRALTDQHACPAASISGADGVGSVVFGSPTVLVNGTMACRAGDTVIEKPGLAMGPMNPIVLGCLTVNIGGPAIPGVQMLGPGGKPTNTFIFYDPTDHQLFITSFLEYSGPGASAAYAAAAKTQIEAMWGGTHNVRGSPTTVIVNIQTTVNSSGTPTPGYDEIKVDPSVTRSDQTLGGGPGNQNPKDVNPNNFVAAHEYGHTLGLDDQYKDTPAGSVPDPTKTSNTTDNIMCQTWPDSTTGASPHPYDEHYDSTLTRLGL